MQSLSQAALRKLGVIIEKVTALFTKTRFGLQTPGVFCQILVGYLT